MATQRRFAVEEANALLGELRERLARMREARRAILSSGERVRASSPQDGGGREGAGLWDAAARLRKDLEALAEAGVVLRDAEAGLVDFPAEREGHLVYLCWRADEPEVGHWHEVDAGFPGRRPL
jgi:hypothetical protein